MKRICSAVAVLMIGIISTTQAATLYLGDGSRSDISDAFSTGTQDWNTGAANWTPILNPAAYQTYVDGSDVVFLGELPIVTVTENVIVNHISRETQVDSNGNRLDLNIGAGNTLTISGIINAMGSGLDVNLRQFNINGPGTLAGIFSMTNATRVLFNNGIAVAPDTEFTFDGNETKDIRFQSGMIDSDLSNLSLVLSNTPRIDNNTGGALMIGNVTGTGAMDLGIAEANLYLKNTFIGGSNAIGSLTQTLGAGSLTLTNGTHTFDIDADASSSDKLTLTSGTLTLGGTLTVNLLAGTLTSGDSFDLFDAPALAGSFSATNLPALTSPLFWDTGNLEVSGSIAVSGSVVTNYTGTLYLGDGSASYTNSPATWDTTSSVWGLGPNVGFTAWTNWIDGGDVIFNGSGAPRVVNMATNLSVIVDELVWNAPAEAIQFNGDAAVSQTLTVTSQIRTDLDQTARQITLRDINLGGSFTLANVSRLSIDLGTAVLPNTEILTTDGSDIQFNGSTTDFSDLHLTMGSSGGSMVFNRSVSDKTLGFLGGTGEIRVGTNTVALTVNNVTVGGTNNVSAITAGSLSTGNLVLGGGTHRFNINTATTTADLLGIGPGSMTFGGTLDVTISVGGTPALGDTFNLFDAGSFAGAFSAVNLPALSGDLVWHNNLGTDGTLSVGTPGTAYSIVNFTDFAEESTWVSDVATTTSGSITNSEGTVFTLTVSNVSETPVDPVFLYTIAIAGIKGTNGNSRLDSLDAAPGVTNTANDEILRFELSVSGTPVESLGLKSLELTSFAVGEVAEFSDGSATRTLVDNMGSDIVSYDDVLAGLTELTATNIGTWYLDVASRDNNNITLNTFSPDEIKFVVGYSFASAFDLWSADHGLTEGPEGDDDGDRMSNLYEYGLGGDPTNSADTGFIEYGVVENGGTNTFDYIYARRTDDVTLNYYLELTRNLVAPAWTNSGYAVIGIGPDTGGFETVSNRISITEGAEFIRLIIEQN